MAKLMGWPVQFLISLWLIGLVVHGLSTASASDPWTYFHPEQVKAFGCKVTDTEISLNGMARGELIWEATAFADRTTDRWEMQIAQQPHTLKGRHEAEKACMRWQDEAEKRVYGVHKR